MKIRSSLVYAVIFGLCTLSAHGQLDRYANKRSILELTKDGWYKIRLNPDVLSGTSSSMNDVRIFKLSDVDTSEVPFVLTGGTPMKVRGDVAFDIINRGSRKSAYYFTIRQSKSSTIHQMEIDVHNRNFEWDVTLEGSMNQSEWITLRRNTRFVGIDNRYVEYKFTTLHFDPSNYIYFRVSIETAEPHKVRLRRAFIREYVPEAEMSDSLSVKQLEQIESKENKTTELIARLPSERHVKMVRAELANSWEFYRNVGIYCLKNVIKTQKGEVENWELVEQTVFSSLEPNIIRTNPYRTSAIKLVVKNFDDQPVTFSEIVVFSEAYFVVARLNKADRYILAYGRPGDRKPVYDIVYFKDKIPDEPDKAFYGELYKEERSALEKLFFDNQFWLWGIMIVIILFMGYFSVKMLKGHNN